MPSQFGAPAKVSITEEDNKIKIECWKLWQKFNNIWWQYYYLYLL
jgi:hypothetical protein